MSGWQRVPEVLFYDLKPPMRKEGGKIVGLAPFDGKPVLVYDPKCRANHDCAEYVQDVPCIMAAKWVGSAWWSLMMDKEESWVEGDGDEVCVFKAGVMQLFPTLWMPLEELPALST